MGEPAVRTENIIMEDLENNNAADTPTTKTEKIIRDLNRKFESDKTLLHETDFFRHVLAGNYQTIKNVSEELKNTNTDLQKWCFKKLDTSKDNEGSNYFLSILLVLFCSVFALNPLGYLVQFVLTRFAHHVYEFKPFISKFSNLRCPFIAAVLSGNEKMIKIFINWEKDLKSADGEKNNIFHYIADMSGYQLTKAKKCFTTVKTLLNEDDAFRKMITAEPNSAGLTAVEYAFKYGYFQMGTLMIDETSDMTYFCDEDPITEKTTGWVRIAPPGDPRGPYKPVFILMILHLFTSRRVEFHSPDDLSRGMKHPIVKKWIEVVRRRCHKFMFPTNLLWEIFITGAIIFLFQRSSFGLIFNSPNQDRLVNEHVKVFLTKWNHTDFVSGEKSNLVLQGKFFTTYSNLQQKVEDGKYTMDYTELLELIQTLPGYDDYSKDSFISLYDEICLSGSMKRLNGIILDNCTQQANKALLPVCEDESSYEFMLKGMTVAENEFLFYEIFSSKYKIDQISIILGWILASYFFIYILYDILQRFFAIYNRVKKTKVKGNIIRGFLETYFGCYITVQANLVTACFFCIIFFFENADLFKTIEENILHYDNRSYFHSLFFAGLFLGIYCARSVIHIHSLLYISGLHTFVISLFHMAVDGVMFLAMYIWSLVTFTLVLMSLDTNLNCPKWSNNQAIGFLRNMFTNYFLSLGLHSDEKIFENDVSVIVFLVYTVVNTVLLLNLLIAVMTATQTVVSSEPQSSYIEFSWKAQEYIGVSVAPFWLYNRNCFFKPVLKMLTKHLTGLTVYMPRSSETNEQNHS